MNRSPTPSPRLSPLPIGHAPEVWEHLEAVGRNLGFVPNSVLIMQRNPKLVKAPAQMLAAVWEYQSSPLYSEAERAALDLAFAASVVPNAVGDDHFAELRRHWSEDQIVEIVATIAMFGFLNRWNDSMGTPLEDKPMAAGDRLLKRGGWTPGKHRS